MHHRIIAWNLLGKSVRGFGYVRRWSIVVDYFERKEKEEKI